MREARGGPELPSPRPQPRQTSASRQAQLYLHLILPPFSRPLPALSSQSKNHTHTHLSLSLSKEEQKKNPLTYKLNPVLFSLFIKHTNVSLNASFPLSSYLAVTSTVASSTVTSGLRSTCRRPEMPWISAGSEVPLMRMRRGVSVGRWKRRLDFWIPFRAVYLVCFEGMEGGLFGARA